MASYVVKNQKIEPHRVHKQTVGIHIEKFYVAFWHWIINAKIWDASYYT